MCLNIIMLGGGKRAKGKRRLWGLGRPAEYGRITNDEEKEREREREEVRQCRKKRAGDLTLNRILP